jgi:hypothetical protein
MPRTPIEARQAVFKLMMLIKKRPELSRHAFIDYYDKHHIKLLHSIQPKGAAIHRRHFVVVEPGQPEPDYDVISEVIYEDRATAEAAWKILAQAEKTKIMIDDEEKFIVRSSLRRFVVETHETVFRPLPTA